MIKFLKTKASAAALGVSLFGALAASPAAHASVQTSALAVTSAVTVSAVDGGKCNYRGTHPLVRPGNTSAKVTHAQCLLKNYQGFGSQQVTGFYGEQTGRHVRAFQKNNGLSQDGVIGSRTWGKLHP